MGPIFLLLLVIGVYLILRSYYQNLTVRLYMGYGVLFVAIIWIVYQCGSHIRITGDDLIQTLHDTDVLIDDLQWMVVEHLPKENVLNNYLPAVAPKDGECGICCEAMKSEELLECPECHKIAHKDCLDKWIQSGQTVCIYCRYDLTF